MNEQTAIAIGALIALILVAGLCLKLILKNRQYHKRLAGIIDMDKELKSLASSKKEADNEIQILRNSYKEKRVIYDKLKGEIAIYENEFEMLECGFYKPHFDFDTSEIFKEEISNVKTLQRTMVREKTAVTCSKEWTVEGSRAQGKTMVNRSIRLTSRAFNNECDAAVSNVRWNNISQMETRIEKAFDTINKLNDSQEVYISSEYLDLKVKELQLTHEYKDKKQQEKEEKAERRMEMREEAKLEKELENSIKEEEKFEKLLNKAKLEAAKASGEKLMLLSAKIESLSVDLQEAHSKSERAKSMAQQTKVGHIYIISNTGSFGSEVYKIGMTRRLDPLDRVKELGDASVPFTFDIHAMIYTENAPELERSLHNKFSEKRLNLVNNRKEFFKVSLDEIESEVMRFSPETEFVRTAEARQYRETQALLAQREEQMKAEENDALPLEI